MNTKILFNIAKPADIILVSGECWISNLIKHAQSVQTPDRKPSLWSHSMLYVNEQTVLESTIDFKPYGKEKKKFRSGVQYNNLSNYEHIKTVMLIQFPFSYTDREKMIDRAESLIGNSYPIAGLIGSLLSFWLFPKWASNPLQGKHKLKCSGYIQEVYKIKGIDFDPIRAYDNTSPEIIYQYKDGATHTWLM